MRKLTIAVLLVLLSGCGTVAGMRADAKAVWDFTQTGTPCKDCPTHSWQ